MTHLKRALFSLLTLLPLLSWAQSDVLNTSYFLASQNPAFIVSPLDYNQWSVSANSKGLATGLAHINIDPIYSAAGIQVNRFRDNTVAASLRFASHTYFLPRELHLQAGIEMTTYIKDSQMKYAPRFGLLLLSAPNASDWMFGVTYTRNQQSEDFLFGNKTLFKECYAVQAGKYILAITRRMALNASLFAHYGITVNGEKQWALQGGPNLKWNRYTFSPGWRTTNFTNAQAYARFSRGGKYSLGLACIFFTDQSSSFQNIELSIQHRF